MSIVLDVIEKEELFTNSLGVEVQINLLEKAEQRKKLQRQIRQFLKKGGKIVTVEPSPFVPHYKQVGISREGMTGASRTYSSESL